MIRDEDRQQVILDANRLEFEAEKNPANWVKAARRWQRLGEPDRAINAFIQAQQHKQDIGDYMEVADYIKFHLTGEAALGFLENQGKISPRAYIDLIEEHWARRDSEGALNAIFEAANDGVEDARNMLAVYSLNKGNTDEALEDLTAAVENGNRAAPLMLAACQLLNGHTEHAEMTLQVAAAHDVPGSRMMQGLLFEMHGSYPEALSVYEDALVERARHDSIIKDGENPAAAFVRVADRLGVPANEQLNFLEVYADRPETGAFVPYMKRAKEAGQLERIEEFITGLMSVHSGFDEAFLKSELADVYAKQGKVDQACETYVDAIQAGASNAFLLCKMWLDSVDESHRVADIERRVFPWLSTIENSFSAGTIQADSNAAVHAELKHLETIQGVDLDESWTKEPEARYARFMAVQGRGEDAAERLEGLIALGRIDLFAPLADTYRYLGDIEREEGALDRWVAARPKEALFARGQFYAEQGNWNAAAGDYLDASRMSVLHCKAAALMAADCLSHTRHIDSALDLYSRAKMLGAAQFALSDRPPEITTVMAPSTRHAEFLERIVRYEDARQLLANESRYNVRAFAPLAQLCVRLGDAEGAIEARSKARRHEPESVIEAIDAAILGMTRSLADEATRIENPKRNIRNDLDFGI